MNLDHERILVTGGAGFIGSHLVDRLLENPRVAEVRVLDNLSNGRWENLAPADADPRLRRTAGDLLDADAVRGACEGVTVIFHLACLGVRHSLHHPLENLEVNSRGTMVLLEAARRERLRRFVHVSSSEVYGTATAVPMTEEHPTHPTTVYGAGKLCGEACARAVHQCHGLPVVVVRPFNTYGRRSHFEGDSGEVIPRTILRLLCGMPAVIFGDGTQTRDFLHVADTSRGLVELACCDAAVGQTVNLGSGAETSILDVCGRIASAVGGAVPAPHHLPSRPGDVLRLRADTTRVRRLTGLEPRVTLAEGLADLVAWFRQLPDPPQALLARMPERNWESPPGNGG